jgi:hypothetical protein
MNKTKIKSQIEKIEKIIVKRWLEDKNAPLSLLTKQSIVNNNLWVENLAGSYLDNYEFERYNELKMKLACLKDSKKTNKNA